MEDSDQRLINSIHNGNVAAFEELYKKYYVFLCLVAEHIVRNPSDAEEIVSDVFFRVWNIREKIEITTSLKAYLVRAVHNTSLNYLEQNSKINKLTEYLSNSEIRLLAWDSDYPLGQLYEKEIREEIDKAISTLPDACRKVFLLSRNEGLKYCDIADRLGISINTVKGHMKLALARLRESVKYYLAILLIAILF